MPLLRGGLVCRWSQLQHVYDCNGHVIPSSQYFMTPIPSSDSDIRLPSLPQCSLSLGEDDVDVLFRAQQSTAVTNCLHFDQLYVFSHGDQKGTGSTNQV